VPNSAEIEAVQLAPMVANTPVGSASALGGGAIMVTAVAFEGRSLLFGLALWYALLAVAYASQVGLAMSLRPRLRAGASPRSGLRRFTAVGTVEGLVWSVGIIGVAVRGSIEQELTALLLGAGVAAGAALSFGTHMPTYLCRFFAATVPYIVWAAVLRGDGLHLILALTVVVYSVSNIQLTRAFNASFLASARLRLANESLVDELRRQKEAAEEANVAKSRFIASASHDLRQPVHALGLLVTALEQQTIDPPTRQLVEQIGGSVAAMDGLFHALLDISRLEAGVVEVRQRRFALRPLVERVLRDVAWDAAAKGIELRAVGCSAVANSDPVLVERIVRNLVSNAVRYTDRGRVLVGCRRHANLIALEVWDTGRGIPAAEQERIFQEYYQIGNPERDRAKGLGLGLAIVRRLADLLGARLTFRSEPGKGSCFAIALPLAEGAALTPEPPDEDPSADEKTDGLIVVVDDEAPIREGMTRVLNGWGFEVVAAESGEEAIAHLAGRPDRPALLICDYRLRGGENGLDLIDRLRDEYNATLPAILLTGDTAPDILAAVHARRLTLLHKPAPNVRLRAAIASAIAAAVETDASGQNSDSRIR
jgi:signal transduction histidine kinase/CheY-like chemotaxis protein